MTDLDTILADWKARAQTARGLRDERMAGIIEELVHEVEMASEDYRRRLTEREAANWSGKSVKWLRRQFPEWEEQGHAWQEGRQRWYRAVVVPKRVNVEVVKDDARQAAREAAA